MAISINQNEITLTLDSLKEVLLSERESLNTTLETYIKRQTAGGVTRANIVNALEQDFNDGGPVFGSFLNRLTGELAQGFDAVIKREEINGFTEFLGDDADQPFIWVALLVNTCPDCIELHGEVKKYSEWEAEGVPNVRGTVCTIKGYCHCVLLPTDTLTTGEIEEMREPLKMQKERVNEYKKARSEAGVSLSASYRTALLGQANNPEGVINKFGGS